MLLKYIKEYCQANNISVRKFLISRGINSKLLYTHRDCFSFNVLLKLDDVLKDKKEFKDMVLKRMRIKLKIFYEIDIDSIPDEVLFDIYNKVKEYKK